MRSRGFAAPLSPAGSLHLYRSDSDTPSSPPTFFAPSLSTVSLMTSCDFMRRVYAGCPSERQAVAQRERALEVRQDDPAELLVVRQPPGLLREGQGAVDDDLIAAQRADAV